MLLPLILLAIATIFTLCYFIYYKTGASFAEKQLKDAEAPTQLPVGRAEFDTWSYDIIRLAQSPDNDSVRYALAVMIQQFPASVSKVPKRTLVDMLLKSMSNQVASAVIYELKTKQQAEAAAAKAAIEQSSGPQQ